MTSKTLEEEQKKARHMMGYAQTNDSDIADATLDSIVSSAFRAGERTGVPLLVEGFDAYVDKNVNNHNFNRAFLKSTFRLYLAALKEEKE